MISIVIPLYNKEEYIEKTLNSIRKQSFKDFECIVVNDGSTDKSVSIVETFLEDSRFKLYSIPNSGVSCARNFGVLKATNDYVSFLDADDYWHENFLYEMVKLIHEFPNVLVFSVTRELIYNDKRKVYYSPYLPLVNDVGYIDFFKIISKGEPPLHSSSSCFNKAVFGKSGYFKVGQKNFEDHDLWMRVALYFPIVYLNKILVYHQKEILNSASQNHLSFSDLCSYFETLNYVYVSLCHEDKLRFSDFIYRFIKYCLLKYAYSKEERFYLLKLASYSLRKKRIARLYVLVIFRLWNIYKIYKVLK